MNSKFENSKLVDLKPIELIQTEGGIDIGDWIDKNYKELKGAIIDAYNDAMSAYNASH